MKMNRIFSTLILMLICGQLSSCEDYVKTFEGFFMKHKALKDQLPYIRELNGKLSSLYQSEELIELLSAPEELKEKLSADKNISAECKNSLIFAAEHVRSNWTINMLDATAKPPSGIRYGALTWVGNFEMCMSNPPPKAYSGVPPRSHYCRIKFGGTPSTTILDLTPKINVGFCLPETCSAHDIYEIIQFVVKTASSILPNATIPAAVKHEDIYCHVRQEDMKFDAGAVVMLIISSIFGILIIIGSVYDLALVRYRTQTVINRPINAENGPQANGDLYEANSMNVQGVSPDNRYEHMSEVNEEDKTESVPPTVVAQAPVLRTWEKAVVAFSAYTNAKKILDAKQQPGRLNCLDGIRFLSMSWVILGHTYFFALSGAVNNLGSFMIMLTQRWTYEAILNATYSVDSFFLLSGMLTAYMFMKEANKMGTINNGKFWILYFLHRFWRLTPPYMLFLGFYTALYRYMSNGPLWSQNNGIDEQACRTNWWTNLLYVNNIVKSTEMCMGWTWYLANDMQFHYFVAPVILVLMFFSIRYPYRILYYVLNFVACICVILISLIYVGVISKKDNYVVNDIRGFDVIYVKPWSRVAPYVVGLLTGYLVIEHQRRKLKLHPVIVGVGWVLATGVGLAVIYGLSGINSGSYVASADATALYNSVSRFAWSLSLAWLIYACVTGNGGWINSFLSWPAFIPLSRLTYCAYLVHPVVMVFYYQSLDFAPVVNTITTVYWFFGHMVAAYMVAFVLSVACESPLIGLERILLKKQ